MNISIGCILRKTYWYLLNFSSSSLVISLYLIKSNVVFSFFRCVVLNIVITYLLLISVPLLLSVLCLKFKPILQKDSLNETVRKVSSASKEYLPVYLGYFFVSLSIPGSGGHLEWEVLIAFVLIIWIFTSTTITYYFNLILLLCGYKFYNVMSCNGVELFVISKRIVSKNEQNVCFPHLRKITEYVYIDDNN